MKAIFIFIIVLLLLIVTLAFNNDSSDQDNYSLNQKELDNLTRQAIAETKRTPEQEETKRQLKQVEIALEKTLRAKDDLEKINQKLYNALRKKGYSHEEAMYIIKNN